MMKLIWGDTTEANYQYKVLKTEKGKKPPRPVFTCMSPIIHSPIKATNSWYETVFHEPTWGI